MKFAHSVFGFVFFMMFGFGGHQFLMAHPGHGIGGGSHEVTHYLSEPLHLSWWIALVFVGVILFTVLRFWRLANIRQVNVQKD